MAKTPCDESCLTGSHRNTFLFRPPASLQRYLRPMYRGNRLNVSQKERFPDFDEIVRMRLRKHFFDEHIYFQDGMTLVELIKALLSNEMYSGHYNWTYGLCFHSDWLWGYFVNFYNIGSHVADPAYADVLESRLEAFEDSEIHSALNSYTGTCTAYSPETCNVSSVICHYQTPESMSHLYESAKAMFPGRYRD